MTEHTLTRSLSQREREQRRRVRQALIALATTALVAACSTPASTSTGGGGQGGATTAPRTLAIGIRVEPNTIASKGLGQVGITLGTTKRLFNADLTIRDGQGTVLGDLAETLPALNTDSWQVFPDGRMETVYRLKPNIVWHDGTPLTPEDFAFALRVYSIPELGNASLPPINSIGEVRAPDARTVVIRWKRPYADAGILGGANTGFPPLPRHLLETALQDGSQETFANSSYWTREFVGLGPYRIERWEPGAFIDGVAFAQHMAGRPKIDRVHITFISDPNVALANLLAGEIQLSADDSLRFEQGSTLRKEWGETGGTVLWAPSLWRATAFQLRPELASPRAQLDPRVRKALAFAVDKRGLNEAIFQGQGIMADFPVPPGSGYYADLIRSAEVFPYDPRRSQQLMTQAGYGLGSGGFYAGGGSQLDFALRTTGSSQNEAELSILGEGWRRAGFNVGEGVLPAAQGQDAEVRATFPSMFTSSGPFGEATLAGYVPSQIPRPENRWNGSNRGGWTNPDFGRLADQFSTSLDRLERDRLIIEMAKAFSSEEPVISLHFNAIPVAFSAALHGPGPYTSEGTFSWNAPRWELK